MGCGPGGGLIFGIIFGVFGSCNGGGIWFGTGTFEI